jgi:general secretion pathway protein G
MLKLKKMIAQQGAVQMPKNEDGDHAQPNGFTLVEMLVTVFILGLLTTVVVLAVLPNQDKAMVQKAKADISTLSQAMEIYRLDNATYPSAADGLQALMKPTSAGGSGAGYIKKLPNDPWGRPYQYSNPGRAGAFDVYSLGADGAPGGENENADIYSE